MGEYPEVIRILPTKKDIHGRPTEYEYYYALSYEQERFLKTIMKLWENGTTPANGFEEFPKLIRRVLRTKDYNDNDRSDFLKLRQWYIKNFK